MEMNRSSTVAKFIQRFREAKPLSPRRRRRDRQEVEGEFWWTRSSDEDGRFGMGRNSNIINNEFLGRGTDSTPNLMDAEYGSYLFDNQPSGTKPPMKDKGVQSSTPAEETRKCSRWDTAAQVLPVPDETGPSHPILVGGIVVSALWDSPCSPGSPGQSLTVGGEEDLSLQRKTSGLQEPNLVMAGADQHVAGTDYGNKPRPVSGAPGDAHDRERDDRLAHLDARACTLLKYCKHLLASSTFSDQVARHKQLDSISSDGDRASIADGVNDDSPEGLEYRAWMLLKNRETLDQATPTGFDGGVFAGKYHVLPASFRQRHQRHREVPPWEDACGQKELAGLAPSGSSRKDLVPMDGHADGRFLDEREENAQTCDEEANDYPKLLDRKAFVFNPISPEEVVDFVFDETKGAKSDSRGLGGGAALSGRNQGSTAFNVSSTMRDSSTLTESVLDDFTGDEIRLCSDCGGSVHGTNEAGCDEHRNESTEAKNTWAVSSKLTLATSRRQKEALPPILLGEEDHDWPFEAWLEEFAEDSVVAALLQRASCINRELESLQSLQS